MLRTSLALSFVLLFGAAASAAPILQNPPSVEIGTIFGVGNDFTIVFDGGDTSDNVLNYTAQGDGSPGFLPSAAIGAVIFDTPIVAAGDSESGFFNPDNVVRGLAFPGTGAVAGLLVDGGSPSSESFWVQLESTPSHAYFVSLSASRLSDVKTLDHVHEFAIHKQRVDFTVVPEPNAALVFGVGLIVAWGAARRRA